MLPDTENSPWNSSCDTATDSVSPSPGSRSPASSMHTGADSARHRATSSGDGHGPPAAVWARAAAPVATAAAVQQATTEQDLLSLTCGPAGNVVRLIPALVVSEEEIALGLQRFEAAVEAVVSSAPSGTTGA